MNHRRPGDTSILGVMLIAMSLRAPITGIGPLIGAISADLGLGGAAAGALVALPLLAFACASLVAPALGQRLGVERSLFASMVILVFGILLRSGGGAAALFAGTAAAGLAIAIGNVLLPTLLKQGFADRAASLTAAYVLAMSLAAGVASVVAVPLSLAWSWRSSAAAMLVIPLLAAIVCLPLPARALRKGRGTAAVSARCVWRSALAWQVALYMGFNAVVFYVCIAWLPAILIKAGYSPREAGALHGLLQAVSLFPALVMGPLLKRRANQQGLGSAAALLSLAGLVGLLAWPRWSVAWVALLGAGTGMGVILGLAFLNLRTGSAGMAAALSGMTQCIGYLLAAAGPILAGMSREFTGDWRAALGACAALCLAMVALARGAGRARQVEGDGPCRAVWDADLRHGSLGL
ncbi:MFS transporter [Castellaniella sp.]|uniref:MFS transporter n=1 Tax=Castellaniella sp. TaxID=1955812 RepID=UPI003C74FECC